MPLNRRKRIFRSASAPRRGAFTARGVFVIAGCATLLLAGWLLVAPLVAPARSPAGAQIRAASNQLAVLDADTLRLGDQVVRLQGIAAPARGSVCHGDQQTEFDCGSAAANALAALIRGSAVDCTIRGHDRLGRPLGDCQAAGVALSAVLVRDGWAHATAADLRAEETEARSARRGIWRPLGQS